MTDLRTKTGRKAEIVQQISTHGGFSVFWVTENLLRASIAQEMSLKGEIKVRSKKFPWIKATLALTTMCVCWGCASKFVPPSGYTNQQWATKVLEDESFLWKDTRYAPLWSAENIHQK